MISRDIPSLSGLKAFEAAARSLSFKSAAKELHVTQSAVSHQIKSLEEFLGTSLFRRTSGGVVLTTEGRLYLEGIEDALGRLSKTTCQLRHRQIAGPLHIRTTPAFATRWLVPRLHELTRHHSDIELHISTSLEPANFADDGIDIDIRFGECGYGDLHVEPFLESTRFPVVGRRLFPELSRLRHPGELLRQVLLHDEIGDSWMEWFGHAGVTGVVHDAGPRFAHCDLVLQAVSEGQGVALAYGVLIAKELKEGSFRRVFNINLPATIIYSLVCPKAGLEFPKVRLFRDWLLSSSKADSIEPAVELRSAPITASV